MYSNDRLRALLELVPDAMIVVDDQGRIVLANELGTELFGWAPDDLVDRPLETVIPERFRDQHLRHFESFLESPEVRPMGAGIELSGRRRDGSQFPVDVALRPWTEGEETLVIASIRDMTLQRRVEDDLRASERRFRIAASHTADVVQWVNVAEDRMKFWGEIDTLMGYEKGGFPRTLSGQVELIHPENRDSFVAEVDRIVREGETGWSLRYRILAADGSYHHWLDRGTVTGYLEDGRPNEGIGAVQDITDQVQQQLLLQETLTELRAAKERLAAEVVYLQDELREGLDYGDIVGESEPWLNVVGQVKLVAGTESAVLLLGETGTGKEVLARALHAESARSSHPLIKVNCAALPSTLIESELFGHEKGAFSGADRRRKGRFELADLGTIFLDEVGELPLELQAKLLQVLQSHEFERLGSSKTLQVDVRVIAATNRDLREEVKSGRFRSDLYYRLAVFPIHVPPLRHRRDDIPLLALYFLGRHNAKHGKSIGAVPTSTLDALAAYDWPGNVRELENLIERAVILSSGESLRLNTDALLGPPTSRGEGAEFTVSSSSPATADLAEIERAHITSVLHSCGWKVKGRGNAAERLGLKESTLRYRMQKLGIQRPR